MCGWGVVRYLPYRFYSTTNLPFVYVNVHFFIRERLV
uniref:Uncharacterized protein n=1 Tax=Dulem virus 31 TaxID=3145749 RepID=A0AAU8AUI9_9VIRU